MGETIEFFSLRTYTVWVYGFEQECTWNPHYEKNNSLTDRKQGNFFNSYPLNIFWKAVNFMDHCEISRWRCMETQPSQSKSPQQ